MFQYKFVLLTIIIYLFSPVTLAKKRCKPLLEKLHHIQSLQRKSYSVKNGVSLRIREDKARDLWWQCENSTSKAKKKLQKKKKNSQTIKKSNNTSQKKRFKRKKIKAGIPFKTSNAIVIKSKYKGDKKQAWFKYYQQPNRCIRPKNLSEFAFCSENKQVQRADFERHYAQE
jgi:hypothetical protein